jgi:hypothetical protein
MSPRLNVLNLEIIDWNFCKVKFHALEKHHICTGARMRMLNKSPCYVCNTFTFLKLYKESF